ncbi:hypothetical protein N0V90_005513 [Kalmusia sp. IMI 367209]|nr:hypothetical protein N0V90_005513 [Kalmusia sp. IMI 367209]
MPPRKRPPQNQNIGDFFAPVPKKPLQSSQNTACAQPGSIVPSTIPEVPTAIQVSVNAPVPTHPSRSPSPTSPRDPAVRTDASRTIEKPHSGPPQSSGNSMHTSKRVLSNGKEVVLNSDSDSDSLADLDALWDDPPVKPKAVTAVATPRTRGASKDDDLLRQPPKRRKDDDVFKLFVQTAQKNAEMEKRIAQAQADLDKPLHEDHPERSVQINEDLVANTVHDDDDPDKAKKLYAAMQRTNALHVNCVFHFFNEGSDSPTTTNPPFPMNSLPQHGWTSNFEEPASRDQAFLSGFAQRVFQFRELPEELASWIIDQTCNSRSEALSLKYIQLLNVHHHHLKTLLDKDRLETIFNVLGADMQCLNLLQEAVPCYELDAGSKRPLPVSLSHLDHLLSSLLPRIKHPVLQRDLVRALPSKSPLTAYLQRHLALSFILYPITITEPLSSPAVLNLIRAHLESSQDFRVTKNSDCASLAARFTLLDIAIGPGPLTVPYEPLISPPASQDASSAIFAPTPSSKDEKDFNREVDALAQQIRLIGNSINVAGAMTDLTRLAANDCCDRLCTRLEHAVRIGGRKLKKVFSKDDEHTEQAKATFMKYLIPNRSQSGAEAPISNEALNEAAAEALEAAMDI